MSRCVTQTPVSAGNTEYLTASARWEACKPPYTNTDMKVCVTAAVSILNYLKKSRRTKYERDNFLRLDFSRGGKVTIYAEFPKGMQLKGRKLGQWPELSLAMAREKAHEIGREGLSAESVHGVLARYEADMEAKVKRHKLSEGSFGTYCCRLKQIKSAFGAREVFCDVKYTKLIDVLDLWIDTKTNSHALELFAELRRVWKFGAPLYAGGKNIAASLPDDYVSSRVQKPTPTRLYTDIESIAQLWINLSGCISLHQRNALRYMILTGVRPINVSNLKWAYINKEMTEITYPAGITGMRGAMKTQKEFRLPVTAEIHKILTEQKMWIDSVPDCNKEYVFLSPRYPSKPYPKRSLDKIMKTYSPEDAVKGIRHENTVKGKSGVFNTLCRKFMKSNVIIQMRRKGYSRSDTKEISLLCLHHSNKDEDPMGEHYDFSDEILNEEMTLKRMAFNAHEESVMAQVALQRIRKK
ncbi:tyrosine-type recombinase/integrase [Morganella morganii]|uniref:tyrosine-type recombinase/integrase n=1 Tax=Morganella morganii TaxID=582 RepID=UPI000BFCB9CA|nr:tyrosine-type recombinase/integrase [Morganella morganii]EKU4288577.1 integrase family protein [Morganella morganii]EKU4303886.1 integrase family protein [Morganella morganii]EKU5661593.1 integrase family protein [Morganella morganii]EKU5688943.1 integrase family protein [Morganella morganii]EKU6424090.1 integrase family protein [Morganella morganii]